MIDLEKERELFKSAMISSEIHQEEEFEIDEYGNFSWIGTDESFDVWRERAKLAKAEQKKLEAELESLKAQLEAKNNAIIFTDDCRIEWYELAMQKDKELQEVKAQLAQQSDDYVLVPKRPTSQMLKNGDDALQGAMIRNTRSQDRLESMPLAVYIAMLKAGVKP